MADITANISGHPGAKFHTSVVVHWPLTEADDAMPVSFEEYSDRSVEISGNFGVGGLITIEGSNGGNVWFPLHAIDGTELSLLATAGLFQILEMTKYIRPRIEGGTGVVLNVFMFARGIELN